MLIIFWIFIPDQGFYLSYEFIQGYEMKSKCLVVLSLLSASVLTGCATESSRSIEAPQVAAATQPHYQGVKSPIAVGKFDNRSAYMNLSLIHI